MRRICAVTWRFTVTGESALLIVRSSLAGMQICYTRPPALVFQCRQCKSVLSDSLLFSCSIEALNVVVVTGIHTGCGYAVLALTFTCTLSSSAGVSSITVGANSQPCCLLQKSDTDR